jgi:hypothetical protein
MAIDIDEPVEDGETYRDFMERVGKVIYEHVAGMGYNSSQTLQLNGKLMGALWRVRHPETEAQVEAKKLRKEARAKRASNGSLRKCKKGKRRGTDGKCHVSSDKEAFKKSRPKMSSEERKRRRKAAYQLRKNQPNYKAPSRKASSKKARSKMSSEESKLRRKQARENNRSLKNPSRKGRSKMSSEEQRLKRRAAYLVRKNQPNYKAPSRKGSSKKARPKMTSEERRRRRRAAYDKKNASRKSSSRCPLGTRKGRDGECYFYDDVEAFAKAKKPSKARKSSKGSKARKSSKGSKAERPSNETKAEKKARHDARKASKAKKAEKKRRKAEKKATKVALAKLQKASQSSKAKKAKKAALLSPTDAEMDAALAIAPPSPPIARRTRGQRKKAQQKTMDSSNYHHNWDADFHHPKKMSISYLLRNF